MNEEAVNEEASLIREAFSQVESYLSGRLKKFDLPLELSGTDFQLRVWNALRSIPWGSTASYKDIATMTGNPKATRAVGMANNRNPIAIIVPCHRVIGSDGSLVGYAGGMELKRTLLEIENPQGMLF
jgi:O-6-methylguanine DNA methyltransferase